MDASTIKYLFGLAMVLAVFFFGVWWDRKHKPNGDT